MCTVYIRKSDRISLNTLARTVVSPAQHGSHTSRGQEPKPSRWSLRWSYPPKYPPTPQSDTPPSTRFGYPTALPIASLCKGLVLRSPSPSLLRKSMSTPNAKGQSLSPSPCVGKTAPIGYTRHQPRCIRFALARGSARSQPHSLPDRRAIAFTQRSASHARNTIIRHRLSHVSLTGQDSRADHAQCFAGTLQRRAAPSLTPCPPA